MLNNDFGAMVKPMLHIAVSSTCR